MAKRVEALVKPELLTWARQTAGFALPDAARRAGVKSAKLEAWERGESRPTITQLRVLARVYKRPLAVFYLPEPPRDFQALQDYRRLPGEPVAEQSPALRFGIRSAHYRREAALDLYQELGETPPPLTLSADVHEDPEVVAVRFRSALGIGYADQITWKDDYDALNRWRLALERLGVLVFQVSRVKLSEMRGFSISDLPLPVIGINSQDNPRSRIFTMLHELTHIVLQRGGLCEWNIDANAERANLAEEQRIEVFCNAVAGAMMVPQAELLQEDIVVRKQGSPEWANDEIAHLVNRFNANREVILRRLLTLGRTTGVFYQRKREEFQRESAAYKKPTKVIVPQHQKALASAGNLFANLVLSSYHQDKITASDLSDLLEVKLQYVPKIEQTLFGRAVGAIA